MIIKREKNNFDFLRLSLSLIVAFYHLIILTDSTSKFSYFPYNSAKIAVDAFFIISGFLIFMSYEHSDSIKTYFIKRTRRIFPAYFSVIIISSILLFFIANTIDIFSYFNIDYIKYIMSNLSTLNFLHPALPELFTENHILTVNGALWTIKVEIMFYISVPIIIYFIHKTNNSILVIFYILSLLYTFYMLDQYQETQLKIYLTLNKQLPAQLVFFISGATLYYYNTFFIKYKYFLLISASITLYIHLNIQSIYILYPISLAIVVLYIATVIVYLGNFSKYGDLSFGIYIWHFPIIQTLIALHLFDNFWMGTIIFIFLILMASLFSWHIVEKRFLIKK